jgi:hypothetical protein
MGRTGIVVRCCTCAFGLHYDEADSPHDQIIQRASRMGAPMISVNDNLLPGKTWQHGTVVNLEL